MSLTSYQTAPPRNGTYYTGSFLYLGNFSSYKGRMGKSLSHLYPRRYDVFFLIGASFVFLVIGLSVPLLTVEKTVFWKHWENNYSVFTGVVELAKQGDILLAFIIFFFSMVFPFAKLWMLTRIWFAVPSGEERKIALHWLGILGKWSMLDVFVVAILVVAAKMRTLTEVQPEIGVYLFGFSIFLSMITTSLIERYAKRGRTFSSG